MDLLELEDELGAPIRRSLTEIIPVDPEQFYATPSTTLVRRADRNTMARNRVSVAEDRLDQAVGPKRRHTLSLAAGCIVVLVGGLVALAAVRPEADRSDGVPGDSPPDTAILPVTETEGVWPVVIAPGVVPWVEAGDGLPAGFGAAIPGPPNARGGSCSAWTAADGVVTCDALVNEGLLPAVSYLSDTGARVEISTLHSDIDAATYATNFSQGNDVGYDDLPLPQEAVDVNGAEGRLITLHEIRRVTWRYNDDVLVAVETNGLDTDQTLSIARTVVPAPTTPADLPLVLATGDNGIDTVVALGSVRNGQLCLRDTHDATCTSLDAGEITYFALAPRVVGLVSDRVAEIRVYDTEGTVSSAVPANSTLPGPRAFAIIAADPVSFELIDTVGAVIGADAISATPLTPTVTSTSIVPTGSNPSGGFTPPTRAIRVQVANASTTNGAASALTAVLASLYDTAEPVNTSLDAPLPRTIVYYRSEFKPDADTLAHDIGGADVLPAPQTLPIERPSSGHDELVDILIMLGNDHAGTWVNTALLAQVGPVSTEMDPVTLAWWQRQVDQALQQAESTGVSPMEQHYLVNDGDTLRSIADRYAGVDVDALIAYNEWPNGVVHVLLPDEVVRIPPGAAYVPPCSFCG